MTKASSFILRLYFAVVSAVTLFTLMYGAIDFLSIGLKTYIFTRADVPSYLESCGDTAYFEKTRPATVAPGETNYTAEQLRTMCEQRRADAEESYRRQKADSAVRDFALVIIALPLFLGHFRFVYRDWKEDHKA